MSDALEDQDIHIRNVQPFVEDVYSANNLDTIVGEVTQHETALVRLHAVSRRVRVERSSRTKAKRVYTVRHADSVVDSSAEHDRPRTILLVPRRLKSSYN